MMKRMIGLVIVGLAVTIWGGCGDDKSVSSVLEEDDDNPVRSSQDLLVGTWLNEDGESITLRSDGTFVDGDEDEGTWSLVEDQLTIAYNDEDYGSVTFTLNSVTDTELILSDEDDSFVSTRQTSTPTESSVSQDKYSETIVGTWNDGGEPILTFNADGTVVYDGYEEHNYTWSIEGTTLTILGEDGEVFERHEITSLSNKEYVFADPEYPDIKTTLTR